MEGADDGQATQAGKELSAHAQFTIDRGLEHILAVQGAINSRTRKVLGWNTPAEALHEQLRALHQAGVATTG